MPTLPKGTDLLIYAAIGTAAYLAAKKYLFPSAKKAVAAVESQRIAAVNATAEALTPRKTIERITTEQLKELEKVQRENLARKAAGQPIIPPKNPSIAVWWNPLTYGLDMEFDTPEDEYFGKPIQ
jgi:hypothetical protein